MSLTVDSLTLEEKVGQVFMFGFPGRNPEKARPLIEELKAGGIIYFARNTGEVAEVAALSETLQDIARRAGRKDGLFISCDQEGGIVARITGDAPLMPGPMSISAAGGPELAFEVSRAIALELRAAGVNVNLAPDLDVNDNPHNPVIGVRSFGADPEHVGKMGSAAVRGFAAGGVLPVGKHFPGHGNTSVDSHLDLPVLEHPLERLNSVELVPFREAIRAGLEAIMSAHIVFKALDPDKPATLSEKVLKGLLRDELGFDGIIMTDCLEMDAIARHFGTARGAVEAFKAGCDMLLISHTFERQKEAYELLLAAVEEGYVPLSRLEEAVERILKLKHKLGIPNPLPVQSVTEPWLRDLSRRAHLDSITTVRASGTLPIGSTDLVVACPKPKRLVLVEDSPCATGSASTLFASNPDEARTDLGRALLKRLSGKVRLRELFFEDNGALEELHHLAATGCQAIIVTVNATRDETQAEFVRKAYAAAPGGIFVAARDPYDIWLVPQAAEFICTYSTRPEAMDALASVLTGEAPAKGRLPVPIPQLSAGYGDGFKEE